MKYLLPILFLIILGCRGETRIHSETGIETSTEIVAEIENEMDKSVNELWNDLIKANPEYKDEEIPESDFFHNNRNDANRLAELTLKGKKRASSGLYSLYEQYDVDLPKVGTKQIVTDFDGNAKVIIENKSVDTIPFHEISKEYAEMDMGTDIEPLEKWKKAHWNFFKTVLEEHGEKPSKEMLVVCVTFEKIWPKP